MDGFAALGGALTMDRAVREGRADNRTPLAERAGLRRSVWARFLATSLAGLRAEVRDLVTRCDLAIGKGRLSRARYGRDSNKSRRDRSRSVLQNQAIRAYTLVLVGLIEKTVEIVDRKTVALGQDLERGSPAMMAIIYQLT